MLWRAISARSCRGRLARRSGPASRSGWRGSGRWSTARTHDADDWFDDDAGARDRPGRTADQPAQRRQHGPAAAHPGRKHSTVQNVPVTWALDPMLVNDVRAMTAAAIRSRRRPARRPARDSGGEDLAVVPAGARSPNPARASSHCRTPTPTSLALARNSTASATTSIGLASESGRTVLQQALHLATLPRYAWPVSGLADQRSLNVLQSIGTAPWCCPAARCRRSHPRMRRHRRTRRSRPTQATRDALLTDPQLSADINDGPSNPDGSRVSLQRFLAETLMIQKEPPGDQRDFVVAPNRRWEPTLDVRGHRARRHREGPLDHAGQPGSGRDQPRRYQSVPRQPLTYPASARHNELSPSYLDRVAASAPTSPPSPRSCRRTIPTSAPTRPPSSRRSPRRGAPTGRSPTPSSPR